MQTVKDWYRQNRLSSESIQRIADFLGVPFETVLGFGQCAWSASCKKLAAGKPDGDGRVRNLDLPLLREINPVTMIETYGGFSGGEPNDSLRGFGPTSHSYFGYDPTTGIEYLTTDNAGGPRIRRRGDQAFQWICSLDHRYYGDYMLVPATET